MKLTTEQIEYIDNTLVLNGLEFEDIKLEVTDHIASEIEVLMEENTLSFEDNFHEVINKWKPQLRPTISFWINNSKSTPSIVTNKCNKLLKSVFMYSIIWGLVTSIIVTIISKQVHNDDVIYILNSILKALSISLFIILIYARYRIWKSRYSSTYSYLFNKNGFIQIFNCILVGSGIFSFEISKTLFDSHFIFAFFPITILFISGFYLQLAYKHFQFENKLKVV